LRYKVLACDYDGTIADDGTVNKEMIRSLERCRESGRHLVLATGRELDDLQNWFPRVALFEYVVAENGGSLYRPSTAVERRLADPPPTHLIELLRQRGVQPLSVGRVIVATCEPFETVVLQTIRDLGLEQQVIFNKGAVMILPAGINKATGLAAALAELGIEARNVVAVGDGENDHSLLTAADLRIAVRNAVPLLQDEADFVTESRASQGVIELIDRLIRDDLSSISQRSSTRILKAAQD
jgi:hydroxymethylpyrimidine pyrophosphatase-like HAD family hydrolase